MNDSVSKLIIVDDHVLFREGLISAFRSASDFKVVGEAGTVYEFPEIKIVFLTIYETDENLFAAIRLGANGFLLKNIASDNLISSLRALKRDEMALSRKLSSRVIKAFSQTRLVNSKSREEIEKNLSTRELDILRELESGASNQEIAQRLYISENTVKHHIGSVLEKLGVENRRQAAILARQNGIVKKSSSP
jgi:DNA-binding NarL/FixJ family response regulator